MERLATFILLSYFFVVTSQKFKDGVLIDKNLKDHSSKDSLQVIEKVFIHTDRTFYYPADDIWFKAYLIDAQNSLLSFYSSNLHVELISPGSKIIDSRVIKLEDGLGNGDFHLPGNIISGTYQLRAYTNSMRNFGDQLFFTKEILVINSSDKTDNLQNLKGVSNKIEIKFFPEGGSLVDDVTALVAFKATDVSGEGCNVSGVVYSSNGDSITEFKSTHLGMGSFFLKPKQATTYFAVVRNNDGLVNTSWIPKSMSGGVSLSISKDQNNDFLIAIRTNSLTFPSLKESDLLLILSVRKTILKTVSFKIKSLSNSFIIPAGDLPDGVIVATLTNSEGLPVCERLMFLQKNNNIRINVNADKTEYRPRDSVTLKIHLSSDSGFKDQTFLSLSAAESNPSDSKYVTSIISWFLLESDIHGHVEEPSCYFDASNPDRFKHLDLLLLTQGWRDFEWKYKGQDFQAENGFTVSGRVRRTIVDKPLENSMVNFGIFQSESSILINVPTDQSGKFSIGGIDFSGDARLIATATSKKEKMQGILILDSMTYKPPEATNTFSSTMLKEENVDILKLKDEHKKTIRKLYRLSDTINLDEVKVIASKTLNSQEIKIQNTRFYGIPDKEIIITREMESFSNAFEVLRGRVAGLSISGNPPYYKIVIHGIGSLSSETTPLVIIDGVVSSVQELSSIPVGFIDRIDVLKSSTNTTFFGMRGSNGIISVITKTGDRFLEYQQFNFSANIKISGYDEPRIFYSPSHSNDSILFYNPDLRTTLFWKPDIVLKGKEDHMFKYFNADNPSLIRVEVQGITKDGIPVTGRTEYIVK